MIAPASLPIHLVGSPPTAASRGAGAGREPLHSAGRGVIHVSRPALPWRWRTVAADSLSLVAVAWSVPLVVLAVGTPIALAIVLVLWSARRLLGAF